MYMQASLHSGDSSPAAPSALKVQSPACAWEFYICRALQGRASPSLTGCFMHATRLFLGPGMSVLEARCERCGTLQDVINGYLKVGKVRILWDEKQMCTFRCACKAQAASR